MEEFVRLMNNVGVKFVKGVRVLLQFNYCGSSSNQVKWLSHGVKGL